jgi:hypothetical protein
MLAIVTEAIRAVTPGVRDEDIEPALQRAFACPGLEEETVLVRIRMAPWEIRGMRQYELWEMVSAATEARLHAELGCEEWKHRQLFELGEVAGKHSQISMAYKQFKFETFRGTEMLIRLKILDELGIDVEDTESCGLIFETLAAKEEQEKKERKKRKEPE